MEGIRQGFFLNSDIEYTIFFVFYQIFNSKFCMRKKAVKIIKYYIKKMNAIINSIECPLVYECGEQPHKSWQF